MRFAECLSPEEVEVDAYGHARVDHALEATRSMPEPANWSRPARR